MKAKDDMTAPKLKFDSYQASVHSAHGWDRFHTVPIFSLVHNDFMPGNMEMRTYQAYPPTSKLRLSTIGHVSVGILGNSLMQNGVFGNALTSPRTRMGKQTTMCPQPTPN